MTAQEFNEVAKELIGHCQSTLMYKAGEYATDDRLYNFKQPVSLMNSNPAQVCLWYQMKHIASIAKIAEEINQGKLPSKALLEEKCGDMLNYTILFYACVTEMSEGQDEESRIQES